MNNSQDISGVVQGLVKEYIVPKYPVYRIKYVKTKLVFADGEEPCILTSVKCRIFEIKDKKEDGSEFSHPYDESDFGYSFRISSRCLQDFENKGHKVIDKGYATYTLISAEKVA